VDILSVVIAGNHYVALHATTCGRLPPLGRRLGKYFLMFFIAATTAAVARTAEAA